MLATDASSVRKIAVVTVVNSRPSARERSAPNAARAPSRYAVLPRGSAAATALPPISAVAPTATTVITAMNSATADTAHDIARRT